MKAGDNIKIDLLANCIHCKAKLSQESILFEEPIHCHFCGIVYKIKHVNVDFKADKDAITRTQLSNILDVEIIQKPAGYCFDYSLSDYLTAPPSSSISKLDVSMIRPLGSDKKLISELLKDTKEDIFGLMRVDPKKLIPLQEMPKGALDYIDYSDLRKMAKDEISEQDRKEIFTGLKDFTNNFFSTPADKIVACDSVHKCTCDMNTLLISGCQCGGK